MKVVLAAVTICGTFALGYWIGSHRQPIAPEKPQPTMPAQPASLSPTPVDTFLQYYDHRDRFEMVTWLEALRNGDDKSLYVAARARLLRTAEQRATAGDPQEAMEMMRTYVDYNPQDNAALSLLSDLYQMNGAQELALEPLFKILEFPTTEQFRQQARRRLDLLIDASVQRFINADNTTSLARFYENLSTREPSNDKYRLEWARWLVRDGDLQAAKTVLQEVGGVGVTADEVDALKRELELAEVGLELIRDGNSLHVAINVSGRELVMLVDTGATMTGIDRGKLSALGAKPLRKTLRVLTAAGPLQVDVYRVRNLVVGNIEHESLEIIALDNLPQNVDGLLGMDIIKDFSTSLVGK